MPLDRPTLSFRHVRLEPLSHDHADALWQARRAMGDTGRLTAVPSSETDMQTYISAALAQAANGTAQPFAVVSLPMEKVVGSTRLTGFEWWDWPVGGRPPRPGPDSLEIGYTWLAQQAQRTAVNTECKWLLLRHAFETLRVERVMLKTDVRNLRSRAAIERIGATLEGILRCHAPAADGGVRDTALFSIVAGEWPAIEAGLLEKLERCRSPL